MSDSPDSPAPQELISSCIMREQPSVKLKNAGRKTKGAYSVWLEPKEGSEKWCQNSPKICWFQQDEAPPPTLEDPFSDKLGDEA